MENKDMIKKWRDKAVAYNLTIKTLKKRIKEKDISRENWKAKYQRLKVEFDFREREIERVKHNEKKNVRKKTR